MANFTWQAGGSGNWGSTSSWDRGSVPAPSGSGGVDKATFDGSTQQSVTSGFGRRPGTADDPIRQIITTPQYRGDIGATGTPLLHGIASSGTDNGRVIHRGTGQFFFDGASGDFSDCLCDSKRGTDTPALILSGETRNLFVKRGRVDVNASAPLTTLLFITQGQVELAAGGNSPTLIVVSGGTLNNYRDATTAASTVVVGQGGTINMFGLLHDNTTVVFLGGEFNYEPITEPGASNNFDVIADGFLDFSNTNWAVAPDIFALGERARFSGDVVSDTGVGSLGVHIDLRENYP